MKKLFFYLFGSIVALFLGIGGLSYAALEYINEWRYKSHLVKHLKPVAELIDSGLARQSKENHDEWLSLVEALMSVQLSLSYESCERLDDTLVAAREGSGYRLCFPREEGALAFSLEALSEQVFSTLAFLILNELGTKPAQDRQFVFNQIREQLEFPLYRSKKISETLTDKQRALLSQGRIIVQWKKQFDKGEHLMVVAPWGKTEDSLVLGPIPLFETYPKNLIYLFIFLSLVLLASFVMLILKYITREIHKVQKGIAAISEQKLGLSAALSSEESIASIGDTITTLVERIEHLLEEKNYAIRAISHDLRTPISRMLFRVEALRGETEDKSAAALRSDLLHMEALIQQLLSYERLSGEDTTEFMSVDLLEIAKATAADFSEIHPELKIRAVTDAGSSFAVHGDGGLIHRALQNLLQNACRYADSNVEITLADEGGSITLSVSDDGPGFGGAEKAKKIFEPFYKGDKSRGKDKSGFGFGLTIVKRIIQAHQGKVWAEEKSFGGAIFHLQLPVLNKRPASTQYE